MKGKNGLLLDLGCGGGKLTSELNKYLTKMSIISIDYSHKLINFAREHHPGIKFEVMDAKKLLFADKLINNVTAVMLFNNIEGIRTSN